jgi:hypothetical protein
MKLLALCFTLFVAAAPPAAVADDPKVRPGEWSKRKIPAGWVVIETDNFHIQSQCGEEKGRALGEHLEAMHEVYQELLSSRRKAPTYVLKIFEDRKAFTAYQGSTAVAYYNKGTKELVGYDTGVILGKRDIPAIIKLKPEFEGELTDAERARLDELFEKISDTWTFDLARVLSHEGWHQYFHTYTVSWVKMPSWLDEGVGDYFFMAERDGQNGGKHGYRIGDTNWHRVRSVRRGLAEGSAVSFEELLDFEQQQYYSNPGVFYAQGWSMVHFLLQHENKKWRELPVKLIKSFKDTKNFRKSNDKVFKKVDMEELEREWLGWLLSLPYEDPLLDLANEFGARITIEDLDCKDSLKSVYSWYLKNAEALFE